MDLEREALEEAVEEAGGGCGAAVGQDLQVDEAGGAVDRDIGIGAAAGQRRQVFDIDMDEAGGSVGFERQHRRWGSAGRRRRGVAGSGGSRYARAWG